MPPEVGPSDGTQGVISGPGLPVSANDTVIANISGATAYPVPVTLAALAAALGSTSYQGTWNATTNSPALASGVGTNGQYYVVSVAGTTTLNGISDWSVGDWAIFNGTAVAWQKVEGGATTMTVGTTVITGGTTTRILYDNAGVLGEYVIGTGVATALGVNVGSAGAFVTFNGALGTPSSGTLSSATGLPVATGISGLGTGVATALAVNVGSAGAPVVFNGALGTPSSGTLSAATGLPVSTGISGLGTDVATFLGTPSSANLRAALTDETGGGAAVFANTPTLVTPILGAATATSINGLVTAKVPYIIEQSGATSGLTGTINETQMRAITIPVLGANDRIVVHAFFSMTNDASTKTPRFRYPLIGGTDYAFGSTFTNVATGNVFTMFFNANSTSAQKGYAATTSFNGSSSAAFDTSTADTSVPTSLVISGQLNDGTDTLTLEGYYVLLYPGV